MKFSRLRYFAVISGALLAVTLGELRAQGARPLPPELPEARPDTVVAGIDTDTRIEVLANDLGMPPPEQPAPEIRIERAPACATVRVDGRALIFRGGASCVGADVVFGYSVKVNEEWLTAAVTVNVQRDLPRPTPTPPPRRPSGPLVACSVPDTDWQMTRIEGGSFDKSAAPAAIADFASLIDDATFSVDPFCMMMDAVPAEPVDRYFNNLNEDERRTQFPELGAQTAAPAGQVAVGRAPATASRTMAAAFSKRFAERSGRALALPTLQEYVAAAWELESSHHGAPQTDAFLILMRTGTLQWTSTPCGSSPGSYWAIGPSTQAGTQGKLVKLCYDESRIDRTGFHLVMKQ